MKLKEFLLQLKENIATKNTMLCLDSSEIEDELDTSALKKILSYLKQGVKLSIIRLANIQLDPKGLETVAEIVKFCRDSLIEFSLVEINLSNLEVPQLVAAFKTCKNLVILRLARCHLSDENAKSLIKLARLKDTLRELHLNGNFLTDKCSDEIFTLSSWDVELIVLNLENNLFRSESVATFCNLIAFDTYALQSTFYRGCHITHLYLADNAFSSDDANQIAEAAQKNTILIKLTLENSNILATHPALAKITHRLSINAKCRENFLDLNKDFIKHGNVKISSNNAAIYQKTSDGSLWLIKRNDERGLGPAAGAILEAWAGTLMKLLYSYYPGVQLVTDGGSFQVAYQYLKDITNKITEEKVMIVGLLNCYIIAFWLGDSDTSNNCWYQNCGGHFKFYKLDMGDAFRFENDTSITLQAFTPKNIIKFMRLSKNPSTNKPITPSAINTILKAFSEINIDAIIEKSAIFCNLLGEMGERFLLQLTNRHGAMKNLLPILTWKENQPAIFDRFISQTLFTHHRTTPPQVNSDTMTTDFHVEP